MDSPRSSRQVSVPVGPSEPSRVEPRNRALLPLPSQDKDSAVLVTGINGAPLDWQSVRVGMKAIVAGVERDSFADVNSTTLSHWIKAMDRTVGRVGTIDLIDLRLRLVKLRFFDSLNGTSESYWYPLPVLVAVSKDANAKTPLELMLSKKRELWIASTQKELEIVQLSSRTCIYNLVKHLASVCYSVLFLTLNLHELPPSGSSQRSGWSVSRLDFVWRHGQDDRNSLLCIQDLFSVVGLVAFCCSTSRWSFSDDRCRSARRHSDRSPAAVLRLSRSPWYHPQSWTS